MRIRGANVVVACTLLYAACSDDPVESGSAAVTGDASTGGNSGSTVSTGGVRQGRGGSDSTGGRPAAEDASNDTSTASATGGRTASPDASTSPDSASAGGRSGSQDASHDTSVSTGGRPAPGDASHDTSISAGGQAAGGAPADAAIDGAHDGGSDGSAPDSAVADGGFINGATCIQVNGMGAPWPPSVPTSTNPECVVNCGAAPCGSACTSGTPCDSGCCAANRVSVNFSPGVVNSSDAQGPFGAMTRDSAGTFYRIRSAYGVYYSETPVGGTPYQVSFTDLDCPAWWDAGPPAGPQCRWTYYEFKPQIALGGPAGQRVTHVAWEKTPWAPYGNRFATKRGTQWTFEDLPQLHTLAADPSGSAWISLNGALYRRTGSSWIQTAVPCGVQVGSFVFDDAGALYLADGSRIWRRDPSGAWGAEATPGEAQVVYVGGGSVHYTSKYSRQPDGGLRPGILYYGRRIGMSWSETAVFFSPPPDYYLEDSQMALDACGAPHFQTTFIARRDYIWALAYVRWTAAGWRQADVVRGFSDPPWAAIGVSTDKAHFIFRNGSATVPLR